MSFAAVDRRTVAGCLRHIRSAIARLTPLADLPQATFIGDSDYSAIAEHHLRRGIEAAMDLGRHLIARLGLPAANDYADVPKSLEQAKLISSSLARALERSARLRNRMVRLYWQVDARDLHHLLPEQIAALTEFAAVVVAMMDEREGGRADGG